MIILTYGEIIEAGSSVFTCVAILDDGKLVINFKGVLRVDNPEKELTSFIEELDMKLDESTAKACDELVPPGSAVANFFNSAKWMKMKLL